VGRHTVASGITRPQHAPDAQPEKSSGVETLAINTNLEDIFMLKISEDTNEKIKILALSLSSQSKIGSV